MFYTAEEVAKLLRTSKSKAYQIIRELNQELEAKGYIIVKGRISKQYFLERVCVNGLNEQQTETKKPKLKAI